MQIVPDTDECVCRDMTLPVGTVPVCIAATAAMVEAVCTTADMINNSHYEAARRLTALGYALLIEHRKGHEILIKIRDDKIERLVVTENDPNVFARIAPAAGEIVRLLGVERDRT